MAKDKDLFAPVPLRAMAMELSGLHMRVLTCVVAHDRLSLLTGKGQGCRASNERMKDMIGCSYGKLCAALSELVECGLLQREKLGRHTVYRAIYNDDDKCLFGQLSTRQHVTIRSPDEDATCDQTGNSGAETCDHDFSQTRRNQPETGSQYIPLNGGIHSVETGEEISPKVRVAVAPRFAPNGPVVFRDGEPLTETLAKFERGWKKDWTQFEGNLPEWRDWLYNEAEQTAGDDNIASAWALRLAEKVDNWISYVEWERGPSVANGGDL